MGDEGDQKLLIGHGGVPGCGPAQVLHLGTQGGGRISGALGGDVEDARGARVGLGEAVVCVVDDGRGAERGVAVGAGMHRDERGGWVVVGHGRQPLQMIGSGQRRAAALGHASRCARLGARGQNGEGRSGRARRLDAGERSRRGHRVLRRWLMAQHRGQNWQPLPGRRWSRGGIETEGGVRKGRRCLKRSESL